MNKYLCIGKFFHRGGKELNLSEKRVCIASDLSARGHVLNRKKSPLGFKIIAAWDAGREWSAVEQKIQALLEHNKSVGDWYEDDDESLIARVSRFLVIEKCPRIHLRNEQTIATRARHRSPKKKTAMLRRQYAHLLRGIPFRVHSRGVDITVIMHGEGKFFCEQTGKTYTSLNAAFSESGKQLTGHNRFSIHAWNLPRNASNQTPDDIITAAANADSPQ